MVGPVLRFTLGANYTKCVAPCTPTCFAPCSMYARIIHVELDCDIEPGVHPRGWSVGPGPSSWDLPSTRFSGFLPLNYVICIFAACMRNMFAMWEVRASLQHGSGLTLGWRFAPYWPLYIKKSPRALHLRKSWVRSCIERTPFLTVFSQKNAASYAHIPSSPKYNITRPLPPEHRKLTSGWYTGSRAPGRCRARRWRRRCHRTRRAQRWRQSEHRTAARWWCSPAGQGAPARDTGPSWRPAWAPSGRRGALRQAGRPKTDRAP